MKKVNLIKNQSHSFVCCFSFSSTLPLCELHMVQFDFAYWPKTVDWRSNQTLVTNSNNFIFRKHIVSSRSSLLSKIQVKFHTLTLKKCIVNYGKKHLKIWEMEMITKKWKVIKIRSTQVKTLVFMFSLVFMLCIFCRFCGIHIFQRQQKPSELLCFSTTEQINRLPVEKQTLTVCSNIYSAIVLKEGQLEAMIKYLSCLNGM